MEGLDRSLVYAVAALVVTAALVYLAATTGLTVNTARPASNTTIAKMPATTSGMVQGTGSSPAPGIVQISTRHTEATGAEANVGGGVEETTPRSEAVSARLARVTEGLLASEVRRVLEELSREAMRITITAPTLGVVQKSVSTSAAAYTGTTVAIPGVDELDDLKIAGGILYYVSGDNVYRVNLTAMKPLEPLDVKGVAARLWGTANISVSLPSGITHREEVEARIGVRGLVYLGVDKIAVITSLTYPGIYRLGSWTGIIVYAGDNPTCTMLVKGLLIDARGADGKLWLLLSDAPSVIVTPLGARPGFEKPGIHIEVLDVDKCEASRVSIGSYPSWWRQPLLLVEKDARSAYLVASGWKKTIVVKLVYNGTLAAVKAARLEGSLPRNWLALTISGNRLILVLEAPKGGFIIYTLDPDTLNIRARLLVERQWERVYAIRLLNGYLYVVTYRLKDPLFTINVTDPDHPVILGWRKGPGFDALIAPLNDSLLVGLGYTDERFLSLRVYRVEENASLAVLDEKVFEKVYAPKLLSPDAYRYLLIYNSSVVGYPVYSAGKHGVLLARIDAGRIAVYSIIPGERSVAWNGYVYVVSADRVVKLDPESFRSLGEAALKP